MMIYKSECYMNQKDDEKSDFSVIAAVDSNLKIGEPIIWKDSHNCYFDLD